jgi:conjugative relaxase-like TrwC/TraI family protein
MVQSTSADHAKAYFSDALSKADYYINDQELQGHFKGLLADRLGLEGIATKETFFALCENKNLSTGKSLTPCTQDMRRVGYDINFHCPKSVSLLHVLSQDDHILKIFEDSVSKTMRDIEQDIQTRVRKDGMNEHRKTGELLYADFVHQTARPVDGHAPDPHLHSHCFVFNATWDDVEQRFKAAEFGDIKRDMPYYEARFHKTLSDRLIDAGYQIRRTEKSFEIEGIPQRVIDLFSKRTDEIGRIAKEQGITDAKQLDALGARTRAKKQKGLGMSELKQEWRRQISELEKDHSGEQDQPVRYAPVKERPNMTPQHCIDYTLAHSFERASVKGERRLLEVAYRQSIGVPSVTLDDMTNSFHQDGRIIRVQEGLRSFCTTKDVLSEEKRMVELAQNGRGALQPLYPECPKLNVSGQQADAVRHILTTPNRVSIIRGAAGAGKTTLLKEAVAHMEGQGKKVITVAPTAQASRGVLRDEGFSQAETVANLLVNKDLQADLTGQVLMVDEAGLLGTKEMTALLDLVDQQNARLILVGDTRQHASVVRGDALRILNTVGGIKTAEVNTIYRQRNDQYRAAVEDLSKGQVKDGFQKLDDIGSIKSIDPLNPSMNPHDTLVGDYVQALKKGKSALVISPTHKQGEEVTDAIRTKLRQSGMIGKKELKAARLTNLNFTDAQKGDWRNFQENHVIQFNQNIPGAKRGSLWSVDKIEENQIRVTNTQGKTLLLPHHKSHSYDLFRKTEIGLSKGDKINITRNGFDEKEKRLNNGQALDVISVSRKGKITLRNAISKATYTVDKDFGHIAHAHCITSHAAQGKTVDEVFIAQPSSTFSATDAKQFYVSVSRARDAVHIYTDDKTALLDNASELGNRQSALELVKNKDVHLEHVEHIQRANVLLKTPVKETAKNIVTRKVDKDRDYEP